MRRKLFLLAGISFFSLTASAQFWDYTDPIKLPGNVNSDAEESIPVFSSDSSIIYFVRTFDKVNKGDANDQDIWSAHLDASGAYGTINAVKELNNKFNNAVLGVSVDGQRMYLLNAYEGKKDLEKGVATSTYSGSSWGTPVKLEIPNLNLDGQFYGFHVNEDENVIIISYQGPNTKGEEDLYVSVKNGSSWSSPQHMGGAINSTGYEISPYLSKSQDTLYFSSNGFDGEGDADIFYAVKQGSWTEWSAPKNLGNRINSAKFDAYFIVTGKQAYWSSNRDTERADIWMLNILTPPPLIVSCTATDATTYKGLDGSISLTVEGGAPPFTYSWSNGISSRDLMAAAAGTYSVTVTDDVGQVQTSTCTINEPPKPIDPVVVTTYPNPSFEYLFGYNKNKLSGSKGEFRKFLKELEEQLKNGREGITIRIYSSASQVPTKSFENNEKLAQTRAENMKYDLIDYFEKQFGGKVNIVIAEVVVQGPPYEDDSSNREKYEPFQYVRLKTE